MFGHISQYLDILGLGHLDCRSCRGDLASDHIIGVRDLPLRDMISLGAWRMGLGCSGKILPSPSSSPSLLSSSPTRIWEGGSYRFYYDSGASGMRGSIRLVFRVPTDRITESCRRTNSNLKKRVGKGPKTTENRHSISIPYRNIRHSYPLKGAVM